MTEEFRSARRRYEPTTRRATRRASRSGKCGLVLMMDRATEVTWMLYGSPGLTFMPPGPDPAGAAGGAAGDGMAPPGGRPSGVRLGLPPAPAGIVMSPSAIRRIALFVIPADGSQSHLPGFEPQPLHFPLAFRGEPHEHAFFFAVTSDGWAGPSNCGVTTCGAGPSNWPKGTSA